MSVVPLRHSLRLRLPLFICGLFALLLAAFLWMANRAVEQALVEAGESRAQTAAVELATVMTTSAARGANEVRRLANAEVLRVFLLSRSHDSEAAVRVLLRPLTAAGQPPVQLLDASGAGVLEIAAATSAPDRVSTLPPLAATSALGLTELRNDRGLVFYDVIADVEADRAAHGAAHPKKLGSIVVRRALSAAATAETINRLVGGAATVAIGNPRGNVWSSFSKPLPPPPFAADRIAVADYRSASGERRIGATAPVSGTPWAMWVDFPRDVFLQTSRVLMRRLVETAALFIAIAAAAVALVTARITTPLHELTTAAAAIAGGQFSKRVRTTRHDEIGQLGAAFNTMTMHVDEQHQELERRVQERTERLQAANQELEAFSYSVSHDLRAPLRHVAGFASLLEQTSGAAVNEEGRRYIRIIGDAATRMGHLIDDLLAFSRVGRAELVSGPVALSDLVRDVQRELTQGVHDRRIEWRVGPLPIVLGDRALLRLVIINLLSNAIKYSSTREVAEIEIGVTPSSDGQAVMFVRDNGVGFDMTYAHKLFGVFQRLHATEEFEGTGIGLANVRRIVQRHGGRVWADGQVELGATFYIALPEVIAT